MYCLSINRQVKRSRPSSPRPETEEQAPVPKMRKATTNKQLAQAPREVVPSDGRSSMLLANEGSSMLPVQESGELTPRSEEQTHPLSPRRS